MLWGLIANMVFWCIIVPILFCWSELKGED
jgi:hypothetical protein